MSREALSIGRRLPKTEGYYEWCRYWNIDPDTAEEFEDGDEQYDDYV